MGRIPVAVIRTDFELSCCRLTPRWYFFQNFQYFFNFPLVFNTALYLNHFLSHCSLVGLTRAVASGAIGRYRIATLT